MKELYRKYEAEMAEYQRRKEAIERLKEKNEAKIERAKKQLEILEKRETKLYEIMPTKYDIVEGLAKKLSEYFNMPYEIFGPFGMEAQTSIRLRKDMSKSTCDQPTISLILHLAGKEIRYETGERDTSVSLDSIAHMNNMDYYTKPLPMDFDEIVKLVKNEFEEEK